MEFNNNPITEEEKIIYSETENILIDNPVAEVPECLQNSLPFAQFLPPVILADLRYTFPDTMPIFTVAQQQRLETAATLSRKISWSCVIDCILVSFILYFGVFYLIIIVIILPVIGFFTSRRFSRGLAGSYIIYALLILGLRVGLILLFEGIAGYIIQGIIMAFEIYILYLIIKFVGVLKTLTMFEKDFLLGRPINGQRPNNNPEDAAVKIISNPPQVYQMEH